LLAQRLRLLHDQPSGTAQNTTDGAYDGATVDGFGHFQARHGSTANGKLNRETLARSDRVVQLEDALERWGWLPSDYPELPVAVNIPEFLLRVFSRDHRIALRSNVVVGKALGHQIPVLLSIIRPEIIPHIQKSGSYLARQTLEVTDRAGHVVSSRTVTAGMLAEMRIGKLMVRQRFTSSMRSMGKTAP
jgi:murein L,D-transpeptidase YcbB/YkuD